MADSRAAKRYQAGVERALALFDATNEWADYIAFLSRLLKALQDPPTGTDIPSKRTIANYLAQCLQPSLPSGVHQKALDVYALIFSVIGTSGLAADLSLYLPGLSHTLAFASLATRPQVLTLYNDHILALPVNSIRPALRALILSLLPGIEEETSEDFEDTLFTINRIKSTFHDDGHEEVFWQNLFLASITNAHRRAGVLVYLIRHLPKLTVEISPSLTAGESNGVHSSVQAITTPEPGLLVRCFATGLQDEQPLVQRGFLDLLVSYLPLNAEVFRDESHSQDVDVLVTAATVVVLRRDMSLNRRLWAWFIGSETKSLNSSGHEAEHALSPSSPSVSKKFETLDTAYFEKFALQPLIRSMHQMLSVSTTDALLQIRPFRVALSLMDRSEIGGPVVESIFVPLIRALQQYQSSAPTQGAFDEVFRSANMFFDGIESRMVSSQLVKLIQNKELDLVLFIITNFNLEEDEKMRHNIPCVCLFVASKLRRAAGKSTNCTQNGHNEADMAGLVHVLQGLLELTASEMGDGLDAPDDLTEAADLEDQILLLYEHGSRTNKSATTPLAASTVTSLLLQHVTEAYLSCCSISTIDETVLSSLTSCLQQCIGLTTNFAILRRLNLTDRLMASIDTMTAQDYARFKFTKSITTILAALRARDSAEQVLSKQTLYDAVPILIKLLWYFLQASTPQYHIESAEGIWRLYALVQHQAVVQSTILSILIKNSSAGRLQEAEVLRFSVLWSHSIAVSKPFLEVQGGQNTNIADTVLSVLSPSLWYMLDQRELDNSTDAIANWIRSLNSLTPIFRLIIGATEVKAGEEQALALALERISKLVRIAKGSSTQWDLFVKQQDQFGVVKHFCSSLIADEAFQTTLSIEALSIIKMILDHGQRELGNDLNSLIITKLGQTHHITALQNALLDTLLAVFATNDTVPFMENLLPTLLDGIASPSTDLCIDKWVTLLCNLVPTLSLPDLMANLIRITGCLCKRIEWYFSALQALFGAHTNIHFSKETQHSVSAIYPERSISNLLAGTEYILARAHQLISNTAQRHSQGVNGASHELPSSRSSANDHLTVVLCMQDGLKVCAALWLWRSSNRTVQGLVDVRSLHHTSAKLRARSRRILENLIEAEPQECLETFMGIWVENRKANAQHAQVLELLQTLEGAHPKYMMPATFNAIYNRTNPAALDSTQRSSLSININAFELLAFLNAYTEALEDDLLDEIWTDCSTFLKEILANPMPHRQILLRLLEFAAVLCKKMENTNFGDGSRMRKELADLCARLFTAIFTIKPGGLDGSGSKASEVDAVFKKKPRSDDFRPQAGNALQILHQTLPDISAVLGRSDRLLPVYTGIATSMTGPLLHSKLFPQNISPELLALLQSISTAPSATKVWKKDVTDAFGDGRFFQNPLELVEPGWLPLIRQLTLIDKSIMSELLSRIVPPATAGLMFGVGATAARTEADRKMSLTLKRISLLCTAMETDYFAPYLPQVLAKIEELLSATPESSPSSATRTEIYILLRAVLLTHSQAQLVSLWPLIDDELRELCGSMISNESTKFTPAAKLQGAKLLDVLLLLKPDEFQLHEWLFVTDTVDAIYPPDDLQPNALADQIGALDIDNHIDLVKTPTKRLARTPWLCSDESRNPEKTNALLKGFFSHLSIRAFEDTYSLQKVDLQACRKDLIADLFAEQ